MNEYYFKKDEDDAEMGCEEDDEDDEDVEDEELEAGEIPRTWFSGTINCSSNIEPSVVQVSKIFINNCIETIICW